MYGDRMLLRARVHHVVHVVRAEAASGAGREVEFAVDVGEGVESLVERGVGCGRAGEVEQLAERRAVLGGNLCRHVTRPGEWEDAGGGLEMGRKSAAKGGVSRRTGRNTDSRHSAPCPGACGVRA